MGLLAAALLAGLAWEAGDWAAEREQNSQFDALRRLGDSYAQGVRVAAERFSSLPAIMAAHPDVLRVLEMPQDADAVARANNLLKMVNGIAGSRHLYVLNEDGRTVAASNFDQPASFVGHDYANRPYFRDARSGRNGLFYGVGVTTKEPGLFMSAPVGDAGKRVGAVAVKVDLTPIGTSWKRSGQQVALADRRGIVFLTSHDPERPATGKWKTWLYRSTQPLLPAERAEVCQSQQYGDCDKDLLELIHWRVSRSPGSPGYEIEVEVPDQREPQSSASASASAAGPDSLPTTLLAVDKRLWVVNGTLSEAPPGDQGGAEPRWWTLTVMALPTPVDQARLLAAAVVALGGATLLLGALYWRLRDRRYAELRDASVELERRVQARTRELQEAHAFRKAMEDSLAVGMRARDLEGRIIYVNPALCAMTGYRADELVGALPPYPFWHPDEMETHWREHDAAMRGQAPLTGSEHVFRHRDGHDVHCMVYTAALIDASGRQTGWMSSIVDLTEQKRAEERQRQHDRELQHAGRLASLGEMASTLAHELNQPLMALSNFAGAAHAFAEQGRRDLLVASLDDIKAQAQRAADIVRRVRSFVRQRTEGMASVAINGVVANVLALSKAEQRRLQARVVTRLDPDAGGVAGDRVLLEQVLLNLLLNALQAMQAVPASQRVVEIETVRDGERVRLRVSDRGPGVAAADVPHLFESFFTTRADGTGLGLRICRTIVESHRGTVTFTLRDGGGAVFTVELPAAA